MKTKFHIMSERSQKEHTTSCCQHLETVGSLLLICIQRLQGNMADTSLPRQYGTDCTQPLSHLIVLFALMAAKCALILEHVEEHYVQQ